MHNRDDMNFDIAIAVPLSFGFELRCSVTTHQWSVLACCTTTCPISIAVLTKHNLLCTCIIPTTLLSTHLMVLADAIQDHTVVNPTSGAKVFGVSRGAVHYWITKALTGYMGKQCWLVFTFGQVCNEPNRVD